MTKARPILFSAPMVQAILENRKTQTRRIVKPLPSWQVHSVCMPDGAADPWSVWFHFPETDRVGHIRHCPYGKPGERLWVRELHWRWGKWVKNGLTKNGRTKWTFIPVGTSIRYAENAPKTTAKRDGECGWVYRHARFMFRTHSRITLEITDVRVQRLQEISEEDAIVEGVERWVVGDGWREYGLSKEDESVCGPPMPTARDSFRTLWESINSEDQFTSNPWVWAITFFRTEPTERAA